MDPLVESPLAGVEQLAQVDLPPKRPDDIHGDERTYRDLIMFEERLRTNMIRIKGTTWRWKVLLMMLLAVLVASAYFTFAGRSNSPAVAEGSTTDADPNAPPPPPWAALIFILTCSALVFFFASGLFTSKLLTPAKTLKPFNMFFQETSGQIEFTRRVPRNFQDGVAAYRKSFLRRREQAAAAARRKARPAPKPA
ncbi:hypothetical protein HK105_204676 [Polyrhizophydium stewartii]|uniref:Transmembrane protein 188 n=1 Tax=Polyrhizophydium stewartii TaxID=2732419 RepID=A0ABR4N875_9FUNG